MRREQRDVDAASTIASGTSAARSSAVPTEVAQLRYARLRRRRRRSARTASAPRRPPPRAASRARATTRPERRRRAASAHDSSDDRAAIAVSAAAAATTSGGRGARAGDGRFPGNSSRNSSKEPDSTAQAYACGGLADAKPASARTRTGVGSTPSRASAASRSAMTAARNADPPRPGRRARPDRAQPRQLRRRFDPALGARAAAARAARPAAPRSRRSRSSNSRRDSAVVSSLELRRAASRGSGRCGWRSSRREVERLADRPVALVPGEEPVEDLGAGLAERRQRLRTVSAWSSSAIVLGRAASMSSVGSTRRRSRSRSTHRFRVSCASQGRRRRRRAAGRGARRCGRRPPGTRPRRPARTAVPLRRRSRRRSARSG